MNKEKLLSQSEAVQKSLAKLDVDLIGIALLTDLKGTKLEETARRLLPTANSILVFANEIYTEVIDHAAPGRTMGQASLNDLLDRHVDYLSGRLTKAAYDVAKVAHQNELKALPLPSAGCPMDTRFLDAIFSYKHAGQSGGLGIIGKSSLLITDKYGPRVRLSACLTEAILTPNKIVSSNVCEGCDVCINNCPAHALSKAENGQPYTINKFACSAFRTASGGCSDCVRVCPVGR